MSSGTDQSNSVGRTVLVSGVTGFVGSSESLSSCFAIEVRAAVSVHSAYASVDPSSAVALEFLKHGFTLHATSRSQDKAEQWLAEHPEAKSRTKFYIVQDVAAPQASDEAIKNVDVVAYTASPVHFNAENPERDMLIPAIEVTYGPGLAGMSSE